MGNSARDYRICSWKQTKNPHKYQDLIKFGNQEPMMKMEELDCKLNWWFYRQIKDLFNRDDCWYKKAIFRIGSNFN